MSSLRRRDGTTARRLVEAVAWRTHLTENDLESTPPFEAWLADSGNREAWEDVQRSWDLFGEHATSPEVLDLRRRALGQARAMGGERRAPRLPRANRFRQAVIAASFVLLTVAVAAFYLMAPDVYRTGSGERRTVTLADGSQVQLDSLTELRIDYSNHARDLKLVKGQARFDVAPDVERPFSVVAAGRKVVAIGTAFNVDLVGKDLFVTLIEGKVVILPQPAPADRAQPALRRDPIELQVGQQLAVPVVGAATVAPASVQRVTAWQAGQLVFQDEPLSSVVARVNRYSARPVALMDEKVAALRISGVFHTGDVDGFISTVTHYLPVDAQEAADAIQLSAR